MTVYILSLTRNSFLTPASARKEFPNLASGLKMLRNTDIKQCDDVHPRETGIQYDFSGNGTTGALCFESTVY
jgi:hypothetical protein